MGMARLVVHMHGRPSDKRYSSLIEDYIARAKSKIRVEFHNDKMTPSEYYSRLPDNTILMDERGDEFTSRELSEKFRQWELSSSDVNIAIGPADGFEVGLTNPKFSLSKLTFPHELAAVVLMEQLYRSIELLKGTSYHRD